MCGYDVPEVQEVRKQVPVCDVLLVTRKDLMVSSVSCLRRNPKGRSRLQHGPQVVLPYLVDTEESLESFESGDEGGFVSIPSLEVPFLNLPVRHCSSVLGVMAIIVTSDHEATEQKAAFEHMVECLDDVDVLPCPLDEIGNSRVGIMHDVVATSKFMDEIVEDAVVELSEFSKHSALIPIRPWQPLEFLQEIVPSPIVWLPTVEEAEHGSEDRRQLICLASRSGADHEMPNVNIVVCHVQYDTGLHLKQTSRLWRGCERMLGVEIPFVVAVGLERSRHADVSIPEVREDRNGVVQKEVVHAH